MFIIKLIVWVILLPIKIILLPFKLLSGDDGMDDFWNLEDDLHFINK